jgi:PAS domain S-box-containing protein
MFSVPFLRRSLKTRITVATLAIFVGAIWSLSLFATRLLRDDMQHMSGEQQFSAVSYVAREINDALKDRIRLLELVAGTIDAPLLANQAALQASLDNRIVLLTHFNGGLIVFRFDGTAIADAPSSDRVGVNYMDIDTVAAALKEGKATVGNPVMGKKLHAPVFGMTVPIRDSQGKVIGALGGVVNLSKPGFLDRIAENRYGQTGGYLLISRQSRQIITATDKSRIMERLPAPDINPAIDRSLDGHEGTSVFVNPKGVEILNSAKGVPRANWLVAAILPTEEAFAPIHEMQQRMLVATIFLTLLAGGLTWWILRRQLAPINTAARTLTERINSNAPMEPLANNSEDEIGELIVCFNHLLDTLSQRDKSLSESEQHYRTLVESSPMCVHELDMDGRLSSMNRAGLVMLGLSDECEVQGLPYLGAVADADRDHVRRLLGDAYAGKTSHFEFASSGPDGRFFSSCFVPVKNSDGTVVKLMGITEDITERKRAEKQLRDHEQELEQTVQQRTSDLQKTYSDLLKIHFAMDCVGIGIQWVDPATGRFLYVNKHAAESLGYTVEEMLKLNVTDIDPNFNAERFGQTGELLRQQGHAQFESNHRATDGRIIPVEITIYLFHGEEDVPGIGITFVKDISRRKETERELVQAKEAAEAANRAKSTFLANMSHELRTPMNGIMGMTDIALRRAVDPKQKDQLTKVIQSAKRLLTIINEILDISKIEAEQLVLENIDFNLLDVIEHATGMFNQKVNEKGLRLIIEADPELRNLLVQGDPVRLGQVLLNLTGNAVKFTSAGTITVRVLLAEDQQTSVLVRFEIQDTGIGIPPDAQRRIFDAFQQADNSMTRKFGGTGLGLAISKRLTELMGGEIGVDSTPDVGSTFWFTVKLRKSDQAAASPETVVDTEAEIRQRYAGQRILVVDDEPINREVAVLQLEAVELVADTAEDGAEAVAMARKNRYAVIFMDMQMPKLNGLEATQEIRQLPGCRDTPIIAMTANAFAEDKAQCIAAGMNDFLIKPFNPDELFTILRRSLIRSRPHEQRPARPEDE